MTKYKAGIPVVATHDLTEPTAIKGSISKGTEGITVGIYDSEKDKVNIRWNNVEGLLKPYSDDLSLHRTFEWSQEYDWKFQDPENLK